VGKFRRVKKALSSSSEGSENEHRSSSESDIQPSQNLSVRVKRKTGLESTDDEEITDERTVSDLSALNTSAETTSTTREKNRMLNVTGTTIGSSGDVTTSDTDNDFLSRKAQDKDEIKARRRRPRPKRRRVSEEAQYLSSDPDSSEDIPAHERLARQVRETLDESTVSRTHVISSDDDDDPNNWHNQAQSSTSPGDSDADFIDDSELDPNLNIVDQMSAPDRAEFTQTLTQQFRSSSNFTFADFTTLLTTLITDVSSQYKPGSYLDKINRPHHYKNHESEHFAINRVQDAITRSSSNLKSGAWNERTCYLLANYPKLSSNQIMKVQRNQLKVKGQNCDVCRRQEGNAVVVLLTGQNYDKRTFRPVERLNYDSDSAESDDPDVDKKQSVQTLHCGRFCAQRIIHFHEITHFVYNEIYSELLRFNRRDDYTKFKPGKKRRKAMIARLSQSYLKQSYLALTQLIQNAGNFANHKGPWYEQPASRRR